MFWIFVYLNIHANKALKNKNEHIKLHHTLHQVLYLVCSETM